MINIQRERGPRNITVFMCWNVRKSQEGCEARNQMKTPTFTNTNPSFSIFVQCHWDSNFRLCPVWNQWFFWPQKHLFEDPFLRAWDFTVYFWLQLYNSTLEWSPIQVLIAAQVAHLQWSYGNWCVQLGIAVATSEFLWPTGRQEGTAFIFKSSIFQSLKVIKGKVLVSTPFYLFEPKLM